MEPALSWKSNDVAAAVISARAQSVVHRLLAGAGRASLIAYGLGATVATQTILHGLSRDGELMVVGFGSAADALLDAPAGESLDVRLELTKESPEYSVRITTCAAHLPGSLEWLADSAIADHLNRKTLPASIAEMVGRPGVWLGVVTGRQVLLHDSTGVTPIELTQVVKQHAGGGDPAGRTEVFPASELELDAREVFGQLTDAELEQLGAAAAVGWGGAITLAVHPTQTCAHHFGRVYCVDIDRVGLTLMQVGAEDTRVVVYAFDEPVRGLAGLARGLEQLVAQSAAALRSVM